MSLFGMPVIERELNRSAGDGALTLSLVLAGYAITPLAEGGPFSNRFGRRPVLLTSSRISRRDRSSAMKASPV